MTHQVAMLPWAGDNDIITLDAAQSAVWAEAAQPVYGAWIAEMTGRGLDGQAMIDQAIALMNAN
jgi:hypothetical protein